MKYPQDGQPPTPSRGTPFSSTKSEKPAGSSIGSSNSKTVLSRIVFSILKLFGYSAKGPSLTIEVTCEVCEGAKFVYDLGPTPQFDTEPEPVFCPKCEKQRHDFMKTKPRGLHAFLLIYQLNRIVNYWELTNCENPAPDEPND